jgi:hypothetical protein
MLSFQKILALGVLGLLLVGSMLAATDVRPVPSPTSGDDGWRWTADGWENIRTWQQPPRPYPAVQPLRVVLLAHEYQGIRYDFHPAALALLQLVAVTMAFVVQPPVTTPE